MDPPHPSPSRHPLTPLHPLLLSISAQLSKSYTTALAQIDEQLEHWPRYIVHKSKQRLTKIVQYLLRMRAMATEEDSERGTVLVPFDKKEERLDASREVKALRAAKIEATIEKELLARLRQVSRESSRRPGKGKRERVRRPLPPHPPIPALPRHSLCCPPPFGE
jgi:hypothetical protein